MNIEESKDMIENDLYEIKKFDLDYMKTKIESLSKNHHIEILKILKKNNKVILNENKNGVFINLSFLPVEVIQEMKDYLDYISAQENDLSMLENQKNEFKNTYFTEEGEENFHERISQGE